MKLFINNKKVEKIEFDSYVSNSWKVIIKVIGRGYEKFKCYNKKGKDKRSICLELQRGQVV